MDSNNFRKVNLQISSKLINKTMTFTLGRMGAPMVSNSLTIAPSLFRCSSIMLFKLIQEVKNFSIKKKKVGQAIIQILFHKAFEIPLAMVSFFIAINYLSNKLCMMRLRTQLSLFGQVDSVIASRSLGFTFFPFIKPRKFLAFTIVSILNFQNIKSFFCKFVYILKSWAHNL